MQELKIIEVEVVSGGLTYMQCAGLFAVGGGVIGGMIGGTAGMGVGVFAGIRGGAGLGYGLGQMICEPD